MRSHDSYSHSYSGSYYRWFAINPRESNDKDVATMLDELTIETNEESFVIVL